MPEGVGYVPKPSVFSQQPQESRKPAEKASFSTEDSSGKNRVANKSESTEVLIGKRPSRDQLDWAYESLRPRR